MHLKIPRLYDSHTHFLATGEFSKRKSLKSLQSADEISTLEFSQADQRGDFYLGFGWDESAWSVKPHKNILDKHFPGKAIYLPRQDGHTAWASSKALELLGVQSETGILSEDVHLKAWDSLPDYSDEQYEKHLLNATAIYNQAGFTHVRDMSGTEKLWQVLQSMVDKKNLTLAVEENFTCHNLQDFETALKAAQYCKAHQNAQMRSQGVKVFFDGSLGSETALLSEPYGADPTRGKGRVSWSLEDLEVVLKRTWKEKLEVSVHVIGDEAVHQIVSLARKISAQGAVGRLNLEHAQMVRPDTLKMMKPLHVRAYMQPCHWWSDRVWIKEKLRPLYAHAFPWENLRGIGVPLFWGCDSPIEPSSFWANINAVKESAKDGIKAFKGDAMACHSHPDETFAPSFTVFDDQTEKLEEVNFLGQKII
jgi:Predicted metal-dependent hydrolase with the TIM-barrel fold